MNDTMQQLHVYEYLGKESDPLYQTILHLQQDHPEFLLDSNMYFMKNYHDFYELLSRNSHECFATPEALYSYISILINNRLLGRK
ncbi:hypothetical protein [Virgibacillus ihumii]|uniref:hypothetical protein n=1 Tax=Virgibacillus ihumii TaxID=2686091 RepID=UPI00157D3497|nr:hypothetical protein [Virgibacillus ihumii]